MFNLNSKRYEKIDQKDLLLSPKVVTDLTGGNNSTNEKNDGDNPNASHVCSTVQACQTEADTCQCTRACVETISANELCCEVSENIESKCCVNPTFSVLICELSEVEMCPVTNECPETQICETNVCDTI